VDTADPTKRSCGMFLLTNRLCGECIDPDIHIEDAVAVRIPDEAAKQKMEAQFHDGLDKAIGRILESGVPIPEAPSEDEDA